jgi:hypothetical protein
MSMHLVGPHMTTTRYNSKKKASNNKRLAAATAEHKAWLASMGITDKPQTQPQKKNSKAAKISIREIPDYSVKRVTSDAIPGNGVARERPVYSGQEIMGITLNHKSNFEPVRRDNRQAAIESARMRRG